MVLSLKKRLISLLTSAKSDTDFLDQVNKLAALEGTAVFQTLLEILGGIDIAEHERKELWQNIVYHRQQLSLTLGRDVDITTAISDYLQTRTSLLKHPRIVETSAFENIVHDTVHDNLTGLANRPSFDQTYQQQISMAERHGDNLSVLFIDIDNFKDINDTYGHAAGDEALRTVAQIIQHEKRNSDIAARYGGEEFVLLLSRTDNFNAYILAERLRKHVAETIIKHRRDSFSVTISGGIATYPTHSTDPAELLNLADSAVYLAKGSGKNNIAFYKAEKRRYLRVKIHEPVLVKELDFQDSTVFSALSKDVCVGGLLFENSYPLPIDSLIKVRMPVGDNPPVLLIGKVVRVESLGDNRYDIGMTTSFRSMDKIASEEIASILRKQVQSPDPS